MYVMGIDGGGSAIRAVIVTPDLTICGQSEGPTANPSVVGVDTAAATIQGAMRSALETAGLTADQIAAVGIGVAGAGAHHSADWLRGIVAAITPQAQIFPSSDFEIALVGALGQREGVLILAGTGSLAYGVNAAGDTALVGGWGYLLDDAGSGYWLGIRALEAVVRAADGRGPATILAPVLLGALDLPQALDLIAWLYRSPAARTREIAQLAPLVLDQATAGDPVAQAIVSKASDELALAARTVKRRLDMDAPAIAFAGGLLAGDTLLSQKLCAALGLESRPVPRHTPVIGAALLALLLR
jgi:N-acetylglucosamine kinase-like BadF-type ATPase